MSARDEVVVYEQGAWLVYDWDHGPYAIALHESAAAAARMAARQGYGKVGFWAFGTELREAVEAWERRPETTAPSTTDPATQEAAHG